MLKLEDERRKLDVIQRQLVEERHQKTQQKEFLRRDWETTLKLKEQQHQFEREHMKLNQEETKKLMNDNAKREIEREFRYKQFFSDYDKAMFERMKQHVNHVGSPEGAKKQKMHDWIQQNEVSYNQNQKVLDDRMRDWRKTV